ncbi:hypothetical protein CERZMDRAFT_87361 [Cercospora zeae-maydis SCOH1-5]|uniref:Uncharacterized protein n=1 Tax=Cercospora zeae-maydis SCOH1-5 TaxID=717836 RepID=A0A6A6F6S3_9PEZI|nr:hypothetical protein CERZMDRAFT_87361 [Cercospora zeae-maydis SCOH1-5]
MPSLSVFPEGAHRSPQSPAPPNRTSPSQFIKDFRNILEEVRQSKQARLDKIAADLNVVFDNGGVGTNEEIAWLETLEDDIELIKDRHRKLGKVVAGVDAKTGRATLEKILDDETRGWATPDLKVLVQDLKVSDGVISGKKSSPKAKNDEKMMQASARKMIDNNEGLMGVTEAGPTPFQRRMEKAPMFDVDKVRVSEATKRKVLEERNDEVSKDGDDSDQSSGKAPSIASSYAARLAKKTREEMEQRNNMPEEIIKVSKNGPSSANKNRSSQLEDRSIPQLGKAESPKAKRKSRQTDSNAKGQRLMSQPESASLLRGALLPDIQKKENTAQQVDNDRATATAVSREASFDTRKSSLHSLFAATEGEGTDIPSEWSKPGAWQKELDGDAVMEDAGDGRTDESLHGAEQNPSPPGSPRRRSSNATSHGSGSSSSSSGLFVSPYKKNETHGNKRNKSTTKKSSPPASHFAPPPHRKSRTPASRRSSEFMRSLFEPNEESYALPDSPPRERKAAPKAEQAARRAAAFYTAEPKNKEVLLLGSNNLSQQREVKKRPADEHIDGVLGAFTEGGPAKSKVRKGGEEGAADGGSRAGSESGKTLVDMGPMKWPGQEVKKGKGKGKGRK